MFFALTWKTENATSLIFLHLGKMNIQRATVFPMELPVVFQRFHCVARIQFLSTWQKNHCRPQNRVKLLHTRECKNFCQADIMSPADIESSFKLLHQVPWQVKVEFLLNSCSSTFKFFSLIDEQFIISEAKIASVRVFHFKRLGPSISTPHQWFAGSTEYDS